MVEIAARPQIRPQTLRLGAERLPQLFGERYVGSSKLQPQHAAGLRLLLPGAFAGDQGAVIAPAKVAEEPVVIRKLQETADLVDRVGKLVVLDRAVMELNAQLAVQYGVARVALQSALK